MIIAVVSYEDKLLHSFDLSSFSTHYRPLFIDLLQHLSHRQIKTNSDHEYMLQMLFVDS